MSARRVLRHLLVPAWRARAAFSVPVLAAIERAIADSERGHGGQIRFAAEPALELGALLRGQSGRERAIEVFSELRVWDTERNNGVLIYLLLADRDVEIVADRGIARQVAPERWQAICRDMETELRAGRLEHGVVRGIAAVGFELTKHFPGAGEGELPDAPTLL